MAMEGILCRIMDKRWSDTRHRDASTMDRVDAALVLGNTNESPPAILSFSSFCTEREREMTFFQRGIFLFLFFLGLIVGLTTSQFRNRGRTELKINRGGVLWDILTSR